MFSLQLCGGYFDSGRNIFQLGDSDFRILREISYKNENVSKFY